MSYLADVRPFSLTDFAKMRSSGEKAAMMTCYDSSFTALLEAAGVELLLIGDSMGNVLQGHPTTLPVTVEQIAYHTACVARAAKRAMIVADMPFGSYHESPSQAMRNAAVLMAAGAHVVKLEGAGFVVETVRFLVERGVPVCGHIGLTPQAVHQLGGYRVQGKSAAAAEKLKTDAAALEQAGASFLVMEMVPATLAGEVTEASQTLSTVGIGAGPQCHGQVLVLHDAIGVYPGRRPRFSKNFMEGAASIHQAVEAYVSSVKSQSFPGPEHAY